MANITPELERIRTAILGEEVRQSIISALEKMNADLNEIETRVAALENK